MNSGNKSGKIELSVEEIIAVLRRSDLPTVIIEGKDDTIVFRPLEEKYFEQGVSIFPVGGRSKLLRLFEELGSHENLIFFADRDEWCLEATPQKYLSDRLVFTVGYSIENDVIIDSQMFSMMTKEEKENFDRELEKFIYWYALAFTRFLAGDAEIIRWHCAKILDDAKHYNEYVKLQRNEEYPEALRNKISADYAFLLRGKSLIHLIVRHLSYPGRNPRHNHAALLEMAAVRGGRLVNRFYESVNRTLLGAA